MKAPRFLVSALVVATALSGSVVAFAGTGEPVVLVATDKTEVRPVASENWLAWTVFARSAKVFARSTDGGRPFRVNPRGSSAHTGGIEGSTLVYAILEPDERSDLALVDLETGADLDVPEGVNTRKAEFSPSISEGRLLFGRASRDVVSVVLFDTTTGTSETIYETAQTERRFYEVAPTQVNGDFAVWRQVVYSQRTGDFLSGDVFVYDIAAGTTTRISAGRDVWEYAPSVSDDGTVFFGRSSFACGEDAVLVQREPDGTETVIYTFRRGRDFSFSFALDNPGGTTDVYFDRGRCRGDDFGDIVVLPGVA